MIKAEGLALERLLNAASREGVRLWGVRRIAPTVLTANISARDFYMLRRLRRYARCRIRILEKHGVPFCLSRLRLRRVLLFGWIPVLLALLACSRFVWVVEVTGCSRVTEEEVLSLLDEMGVRPGIRSAEMDHYAIGREISSRDDRIAWAGLTRQGVVLSVTIVEAEATPELLEEGQPGSLYAAKDGIVKKITALKGRTVISEGQAVKKGDLLITGELTSEAGIEHQVAARGEVLARVLYVVTAEVGTTARMPARSGESVPYCRVFLMGKELFSVPESYLGWEFEADGSAGELDCVLPLSVKSGRLWEMTEQEVSLSQAEQEERALRAAEQKVLSLLPETARIVGKSSEVEFLENGGVRAVMSIETEEDIAERGPLDVKNINAQNGA